MAIRIPNTAEGAAPPEPPPHPGGRPYHYQMIYSGGRWRGYADDPAALTGLLIPGYQNLSADARAQARIRYAADTQTALQAQITLDADLTPCTPAQRELLLAARDTPPAVAEWTAPVPLVLVTSFYQPAGPHPRPVEAGGRIIWIDPDSDWSLLASLHATGWIRVSAAPGAPPVPGPTA